MAAPNADGSPMASTAGNMSDVMSAIQRVLAEHNLNDARFVLEVPSSQRAVATNLTAEGGGEGGGRGGATEKDTVCAEAALFPSPDAADAAAAAALLKGLNAPPLTGPPTLPAHQPPPPRARCASVEPSHPHHLHPTPSLGYVTGAATPPPQPQTLAEATATPSSSPPPQSSTDGLATPKLRGKREVPSLLSPLQYSLQSTESHTTPVTTGQGDQSSLTSNPTDKGDASPSAPQRARAADLSSELAELRRLSHEVAQEVAAAESKTHVKEPLQAFVGRSAILNDRRKRQSASSATSHLSPSNGLPLFPAPPPNATSASMSGPRASAFQPPSSLVNGGVGGSAGGNTNSNSSASLAIGSNADSLTPSRSQVSQRRSVVLVSSPDHKLANVGGGGGTAGGAGSTRGISSSGGGGGGPGAVPSAGSLPSLVALKKSAKPGRTPVFSILNKEGSRLLEGSGGGSNAGNSFNASANTNAGSTGGGTGIPRPLTPSSVRAAGSSTSSSAYASHHSRPTSVSLMADDRSPPSPVFQPLVGSAAEEQACRRPSIFVQHGQQQQQHTRLSTLSMDAAATTAAGATPPSPSPTASPSLLWSEQTRENTRRAFQLQSQSRLSQTTETLPSPHPTTSSTVGAVKHRRSFSPVLTAPAAKASISTTVVSQSTPSTFPPPSTNTTASNSTNNNTGGGGRAGAAPASATPSIASHKRPSLREMLLEQQQLEDASRRGMEEHAKLMQAAHTARTSAATAAAPTVSTPAAATILTPTTNTTAGKPPYTRRPSSSSSPPSFSAPLGSLNGPTTVAAVVLPHAASSSSPSSLSRPPPPSAAVSPEDAAGTSGSNSIRTVSRTASLPLPGTPKSSKGLAMGGPRHSGDGSRTGVAASGVIQVVKFTMPPDMDARQSAVQQLCSSSSGGKHVDSKDRYRAMLATQKDDLTNKEAKEENYKDLLSRAVEYNRRQRPQ
jgi:hypothetical protein